MLCWTVVVDYALCVLRRYVGAFFTFFILIGVIALYYTVAKVYSAIVRDNHACLFQAGSAGAGQTLTGSAKLQPGDELDKANPDTVLTKESRLPPNFQYHLKILVSVVLSPDLARTHRIGPFCYRVRLSMLTTCSCHLAGVVLPNQHSDCCNRRSALALVLRSVHLLWIILPVLTSACAVCSNCHDLHQHRTHVSVLCCSCIVCVCVCVVSS